MSLDTTGFLLEGVRSSTGNNGFTYPPRSIISNPTAFNASPGRADYMVFVGGQVPGTTGMDIAYPNLVFHWTRNNGTVTRFDYNAFARRFDTLPGAAPEALGLVSNTKRLIAPVPDATVTESKYSLYIGNPTRVVSFALQVVETSADFTSPPAGTVQISRDKGEINFGSADLANVSYKGQQVYLTRQSFFDRTKSKGNIGPLPESPVESYHLFLNPIPGAGQIPRIRIGYRAYLSVTSVATESALTTPPQGSAIFSLDTGRIVFSTQDTTSFPGASVYYDGVVMGQASFTRSTIGPMLGTSVGNVPAFLSLLTPGLNPILDPADKSSWASVAATRYVLFLEALAGAGRYYFNVVVVDSSVSGFSMPTPDPGYAIIDANTGNVTVSLTDVVDFAGIELQYIDSLVPIEDGAAIQFFRSAVNGAGFEAEPDFVEIYFVPKQIVQDGITASPSVILPTTPIVDSLFAVNVEQASGGGGSFVGTLLDGTNPALFGFGYLLDLDNKQIKFSLRKQASVTLALPSPSVKLPDAAVVSDGLRITKNNIPIVPGVDFDFNPNGGLAEFVHGVGEDDSGNTLGLSGTVFLPNHFTVPNANFTSVVAGLYLFISSGPNVGLRFITGIANSKTLVVDPLNPFVTAQAETADIRTTREIVADRFWTSFIPPLKKFSILRKRATDSEFKPLDQSEFSVLQTTGQVNLNTPAQPGDLYQISYVWLQSPDNGVTVTPTNRTDFATFKVRQESATTSPNNPAVHFNPSGDTVDTVGHPIVVYIDGVTQDPASFTFIPPSTLAMASPLGTDGSVPSITVDYYVRESPGGNTNFNLPFSPIQVDYPTIVGRDAIAAPYDVLDAKDVGSAPVTSFNGNQTSLLVYNGAILANENQVLLISSVMYDAAADVTHVTFNPNSDVTITGVPLKVTSNIKDNPGIETYLVTESASIDTLAKGTTTLSVAGTAPYRTGMIVFVDGDPYKVISASLNKTTGNTDVVFGSTATRNYVLPQVKHTLRPIFEAGSSFQTSLPAHTGYPFTLVREGPTPGVLQVGADYNVAEGGVVTLLKDVGYGDILEVMYVARVSQPAGTVIGLNYAMQIAPNQTNGIQGQQLILTYDLYSPDTFYFRRESITTFIPEVIALLQKSASSGSSGPNTASKSGLKTKDMGISSLYFDEQHLSNVDVVIQRLLKFYNDLINGWEDILANLDGRVVGGTSGRFRFDGNLSNPPRADYASVTNDVDDQALVNVIIQLTGFFTFNEIPVYAHMYEPNNLSRIYPTAMTAVAALNGNVGFGHFLSTMGSFNVPNLTGCGGLSAAPASSQFLIGGNSTTLVIPQNGDPAKLIPPFAAGMLLNLYNPNGSLNGTAKVVTATSTTLTIDTPTTLRKGGVVQNVADPNSHHFYSPGKDLIISYDTGNIVNFSLPPILSSQQNAVAGNELVQAGITFANTDTTPRRPPVLDGGLLTDSRRPSVPPLSYPDETDVLNDEISLLHRFGTCAVHADLFTISPSIPLFVGNEIEFTSGPNTGKTAVVATVAPTFTIVHPPFDLLPDAGSNFVVTLGTETFGNLYDILIGILNLNTATAPPAGAYIGQINSELVSADQVTRSFGVQQAAGLGNVVGNTLNDPLANFATASPPITTSSLLYVPDGPNEGLYAIASLTSQSITVDPTAPYAGFPVATATDYVVIQPWSFLTSKEPKLMTTFFAKTVAFLQATMNWVANPTPAGAAARIATIQARQADITAFLTSISSLLGKGDKLYDTRYLWIQQRTDKKNGLISQRDQAKSRRVDNTAKLIADQQKLLIAQTLVV